MVAIHFVEPIAAQPNRIAGDFERGIVVAEANSPTRMNLAVKPTAGQPTLEPLGRVNSIPVPSPKKFTIPFHAATVQLFRRQKARETFARPIAGQNHLGFIDHKTGPILSKIGFLSTP
jgi:hypothetical protein